VTSHQLQINNNNLNDHDYTEVHREGIGREWDRWLEHEDTRVGAKGPNGQPNATQEARNRHENMHRVSVQGMPAIFFHYLPFY